jgi:hypothetical protein
MVKLREYLRNDKDGQSRWERYELSDDGKDIYYQYVVETQA